MKSSGYYVRHLPHWQPEGAPLFITWRLHGSLPATAGGERSGIRSGRDFVSWDRELDAGGYGPLWLKEPRLAEGVVTSLQFGERELGLYQLRAWVVMANHVHLLVFPEAPVWRITKAIKGFTAR